MPQEGEGKVEHVRVVVAEPAQRGVVPAQCLLQRAQGGGVVCGVRADVAAMLGQQRPAPAQVKVCGASPTPPGGKKWAVSDSRHFRSQMKEERKEITIIKKISPTQVPRLFDLAGDKVQHSRQVRKRN